MQVRVSEDEQFYVDENGDQYARVSRVLSRTGTSRTLYGTSTHYRDRGRAVHWACALINAAIFKNPETDPAKVLKPETIDPRIRPYIAAYIKFLGDTGFRPSAIEIALGSIHGFAGTIDIVGVLNDQLAVIDIKTGESIDPAVEYQTAAYEVLWHENNPTKLIQKKCALQLKANGSYKLHRLSVPGESFLEKWDQFRAQSQT